MKRFLRETLLQNWNLKVTAILLTMILWLFVRGEPGPERVVAVPLEVQVPRLMEITNERPSTIDVTMRGPAFSNLFINQPLPNCVVDLQGASEGEHMVMLTPENVSVSKGSRIEVLQVNPSRIKIVLEKTISKEVPVVVPTQGKPAQGFEIYGISSRPDRVSVSGPRSKVESLKEVPTETIPITDQKQTAHFLVRLIPVDHAIHPDSSDPVQVDVRMGPRRELHTIKKVPIVLEDTSYAVEPKQVTVQVLAPPEVIKTLTPESLGVTINTRSLNAAKLPSKVKPIIRLPSALVETVVIRGFQPPEVTVQNIKKE